MPDADAALDELRRLADRPPREPAPLEEVAARARRRRRSRRAARALCVVGVLAIVGGAAAWGALRDDEARTVVAGPGSPTGGAPPGGPEPGDPAVWVTDPAAPPAASASSFTALVTRLGCSGGATGRILRPAVVVTDAEVVVTFTAEALGGGFHRCPSNEWVPYRVDVDQPIGDRALVEGHCSPGGAAVGTVFCSEESGGAVRWQPGSGAGPSEGLRRIGAPPAEAPSAAIGSGVMPELRSLDLNVLGDGTGVLDDLQGVIGQQRTIYQANDAPEGTVIAQEPAPGTPLDEVTGWSLTVSAGGPVVRGDQLPEDVAAFASTLPGFDRGEPLVVREMAAGTVYKSDRWLFGLDCAAVDEAYRTFADSRYDTACPGHVNAPGA
jgi:hypothetical protein